MADPLRIVLPVPFNEAIRAANARQVVLPDVYYGELQGAARQQAFSIAGMSAISQLQAALDHMNEGLRSGMSFGEWKKTALEEGWALPEHRLDLILRMHTQTAYQAGHWEQFDRLAQRRGFLMYSAINDSRTRPSHRAMDGVIKPLGDSFWDDHSPPCGYNCRCSLISLTSDQVDARGGETRQISPDARADPGFGSKPQVGRHVLDPQIARAMVETHGTFQDEIRSWYETLAQEKIIDRVRDFVGSDRYTSYRSELSDFLRENEGLIAEHEAAALRFYTASGYTYMNAYLRGTWTGSGTEGVQATVASAVSAMSKLTPYEGAAYRGIYAEAVKGGAERFFAAHEAGQVVEYSGFTSASYGKAFKSDTLLEIRSVNGRVVEQVSLHGDEQEVLFFPGTRFRVLEVDRTATPMRVVLEELKDQNVAVPPENKFAQAPEPREPKGPAEEAIVARIRDEMQTDPDALARFMREHDGLTPLQVALKNFPSARMEVAQHAPHLLPPEIDPKT